jgi:hypothetical protein
MAHERTEIREAVVAQLIAASTAAGSRVYETRLAPIRTAELPAISVYVDSETVRPDSMSSAPRELKRTAELAIEAWARADADVDDVLDALALEIETAMDSDVNLDETAFNSVLSSTEVKISMDGDRPMGVVRLVYAVVYHTDQRVDAPDDDFDKADVKFSLENEQDEADQANDSLEDIHE